VIEASDSSAAIAALAQTKPEFTLLGFLNDAMAPGERIGGVPVLGPFLSWRELPEDATFVAPLHKAGAMRERVAIVADLGIPEHCWTTIIDPRSAVASDAVIGLGCFVAPFASIGPGACLGSHTVARIGAHVSHDCTVGSFVFIGTNAVVCGYSKLHDGAYIAPSATIRDRCTVGTFAVVGLGSVVSRDVPDFVEVAGSPARRKPGPAGGGQGP